MNFFRLTTVAVLSSLAIIAQTAYADPILKRAQVDTELVQSKANGLASLEELAYPPSIIDPDGAVIRAQSKADIWHAEAADTVTSEREDHPLLANRSPWQFQIEDTSDNLGIVVNFNRKRLWIL